jgi:hypothetical protein
VNLINFKGYCSLPASSASMFVESRELKINIFAHNTIGFVHVFVSAHTQFGTVADELVSRGRIYGILSWC